MRDGDKRHKLPQEKTDILNSQLYVLCSVGCSTTHTKASSALGECRYFVQDRDRESTLQVLATLSLPSPRRPYRG